jgi:hypothetical protein
VHYRGSGPAFRKGKGRASARERLRETWIFRHKERFHSAVGYKRDKEIDAIRLRPHPYEFHLYYDI